MQFFYYSERGPGQQVMTLGNGAAPSHVTRELVSLGQGNQFFISIVSTS